MNGAVFVFALLLLQVSASFFDRLYSAVSTPEHGLGNLLSDIVSDVKDNVDSTISAVNDVLGVNGRNTVSSSYRNLKVEKSNVSPGNIQNRQHRTFEKINKNDVSVKQPSIDAAVESIRKDTKRLNEIIEILRQELDNMSNIVHTEIRKVNFGENQVTVESIWQQIKNLDDIQRKSTNTDERKKVRHVLDKVLNVLHLKPKENDTLDTNELDIIKMELQKLSHENSKHSDSIIQSSQLNVNKPITQENKTSNYNNTSTSNYNNKSNTPTEAVTYKNKFDQKDGNNKTNNTSDVLQNSLTEKDLHGDKSLFNLNLLHVKPKHNDTLDTHEMDNVKKKFQKLSHENSEHSDSIIQSSQSNVNKSITQENKISNYNNISNTTTKDVTHQNKFNQKDSNNKINNTSDVHKNNLIEKDLHGDKSVFNVNLDIYNYITAFSNTPVSKKEIGTAKSIIEESRRTDKLLKGFFNQKHKSVDLFSNPNLFDFGKT